ncbi:MAG: N(4)-(beta-N-acetylglucosaminyl)-L-asparaginase [Anaerolineaceae bacterium]|nr:N(4)-(beta-N-acetylglucosaminyl)-L-asparaginase [Anaerolineaceae bacterium]
MIVIASTNGKVGIKESIKVLKSGGSAMDAVEAGIKLVEANPDDHTVGYSGYPNLLGDVELDASIMDGEKLTSGAVGAIKGFIHPISIARKVMENLPHVMLVDAGAARFAKEMGFAEENLLTKEAQAVWKKGIDTVFPDDTTESLSKRNDLWKHVMMATDPERTYGTVNFIAQDQYGNICTGVSTSGWSWKFPGRLGDSPVVGAGNYANNLYGAAACTGMGEMAIRAGTSRSVVLYMKMGLSLLEAGKMAMNDLNELGGDYLSRMNIVAMDKDGKVAAFSNDPETTFVYMTEDMDEFVEEKRVHVPTKEVWGS